MEEVLNKDAFIAIFILLLIFAVLLNLLLLLLLILHSYSTGDVTRPFGKLVTSCLLRHWGSGGKYVWAKCWLVAACCVCHLFTACLHHAPMLHLYSSRQGHLPPPSPCSTLVLTELSAFLFPTLSRLLLGILVVTEVVRMSSLADVRRVTCVLVMVAGGYVSGVLLLVFFFLYLDSASEPCYAGRNILRYTSDSSRGRVMPVLSYVFPVVFIVMAVVVMIIVYNLKSSTASNTTKSSANSNNNFVSLTNGTGNLGDKNQLGVGGRQRSYNDGQTAGFRTPSLDPQLKKSVESGKKEYSLNRNGHSGHSDLTKLVSFPWETLVVSVMAVMLEFVFCVRQFAYWSQVDDRLMSTSQWIQLWAADRILSLLSLILLPCCWLFASPVREALHRGREASDSKDSVLGKEYHVPGPAQTWETHTVRAFQNTLNGNESECARDDSASFDNIGRESYRKDLARERENEGHSAWQDNSYGRSHDTPHDQREARHGNTMNREQNESIVNGFQQSPRRHQHNSPSEKWSNGCEDSALRWGVLNQKHGSAGEGVQRVAGAPTSLNGKHKQSSTGRLHFSNYQFDRDGNYLSAPMSGNEPNPTFLSKQSSPHYSDRTGSEDPGWTDRRHKQSNRYANGEPEGTPSLQRHGISAPNVLSGDTSNHKEDLKKNRSYPNMYDDRSTDQTSDNDVHDSNTGYGGHTNNPPNEAEWTENVNGESQREDERNERYNSWTRRKDTSRQQDKETFHNGQKRRDNYRFQQRNKDTRRENQTFDSSTRPRFTSHEGRSEDYPQGQNHVPHNHTTVRGRQQTTFNTNYTPSDETHPTQHPQKDATHHNRDDSRNLVRTHMNPSQSKPERQVMPFHQQSGVAQANYEAFGPHSENNTQEGLNPTMMKGLTEREGVMHMNERQGIPQRYRIPNSQEGLQRQRVRTSQGVIEREDFSDPQGTMQTQRTMDVAQNTARRDATERYGIRITENNPERLAPRQRPDVSQHTITNQMPRQTAFTDGQGQPRSNNASLNHRQDGAHFIRRTKDDTEGYLGYKTFASDLNPEPLRYNSSPAGHQSQGHSGYSDVDDNPRYRDLALKSFPQEGQGRFTHRGQGRGLPEEEERGGGLNFHSHEQRERIPYNQESLC